MFVVVTLLVALGIAAAQGCQGPARGLGGERDGLRVAHERVSTPREHVGAAQERGSVAQRHVSGGPAGQDPAEPAAGGSAEPAGGAVGGPRS